jgi:hypothetical protein
MIRNDLKGGGSPVRIWNKSLRINKADSEDARFFNLSLYGLGIHVTHVLATSDASHKLVMWPQTFETRFFF